MFAPQWCPSLWVHQTDGWTDAILSLRGKEQKRRKGERRRERDIERERENDSERDRQSHRELTRVRERQS